jgi:hypothetical protein
MFLRFLLLAALGQALTESSRAQGTNIPLIATPRGGFPLTRTTPPIEGMSAPRPDVGRAVKPDADAVTAALRWLKLVDAGKYKESEKLFHPRAPFPNGDGYVRQIMKRRAFLGRPFARVLWQARQSNTHGKFPRGTYEFLFYRGSFEGRSKVVEAVVLSKEGGHWQVCDYGVRF